MPEQKQMKSTYFISRLSILEWYEESNFRNHGCFACVVWRCLTCPGGYFGSCRHRVESFHTLYFVPCRAVVVAVVPNQVICPDR